MDEHRIAQRRLRGVESVIEERIANVFGDKRAV